MFDLIRPSIFLAFSFLLSPYVGIYLFSEGIEGDEMRWAAISLVWSILCVGRHRPSIRAFPAFVAFVAHACIARARQDIPGQDFGRYI